MAEHWVYLSPHFDDVALSLGGVVWQQVQNGDRVEIWTLCGGDPPSGKPLTEFARSLHAKWQLGDNVPRHRAVEDEAACLRLGAIHLRFPIPDCIYRFHPKTGKPYVSREEDLYKPYTNEEFQLFSETLRSVALPPKVNIAVPLGVGDHRDHWLTRASAELLLGELWHYIDYPYAVQRQFNLDVYVPALADARQCSISPAALQAWQEAIACHHSQVPIFWKNESEMAAAIDAYSRQMRDKFKDTCLWKF